MASMATHSQEAAEHIEWDVPLQDFQKEDADSIDFSKLSMGTELRNKMWEQDNKIMLQGFQNGSHAAFLDQNQNLTGDSSHIFNGHGPMFRAKTQVQTNGFAFPNLQPNSRAQMGNLSSNGINGMTLPSAPGRPRSQPLLQNPAVMPNGSPEPRLMDQGNEAKPLENQTLQEELLELKSVITRLAAQTEDVTGLPEPVQLALKVIKLEGTVQERDAKVINLEEQLGSLQQQRDRMVRDHEFDLVKQKKEIKFLRDKVEAKFQMERNSKEVKAKLSQRDDKGDKMEVDRLREDLERVTEERDMKVKELEDCKLESDHRIKMLSLDLSNFKKEVSHVKDILAEQQTSEAARKAEIEKYITAAREAMERERQDSYILLVEQNKLKHKVEKLTESCKSYQLKNEELCRIQNELEQECDQFRKLKKMIQEHGLPSHEQLIMLQQQTEAYKEHILSERKERERAQAQREKMRRDLEGAHARSQSLQEQVYKYQEHIMRLNTGDKRYVQSPECLSLNRQIQGLGPSYQGNWDHSKSKFSRQLSSPAYLNPKLRMSANMGNGTMKGGSNIGGMGNFSVPGLSSQSSPEGSPTRLATGFPNNQNGPIRRPQPSFNGGNGPFDPWQQRGQQRTTLLNNAPGNALGNATSNRSAPRSPLLGPGGDPWPPVNNMPQPQIQQQQPQQQQLPQQFGQLGSPLGYNNNIWSQPSPASASNFVGMRSAVPTSAAGWQFSDVPGGFPHAPLGVHANALKCLPGEPWSTATDDPCMPPIVSSEGSASGDMSLKYVGSGECQDGMNGCAKGEIDDDDLANGPGMGFQCGKCRLKFHDTDTFRSHVEQCFN